MQCPACGSTTVGGRPERTAQGYRPFRCANCGKQFDERSAGVLSRVQYPSDVIALVVPWRLRYKLSLRDLAEMFLTRGFTFSYEPVRDWEAKLAPTLAEHLRRRREGKVGPSWYIDETYIRVRGRWRYRYRAIDRDGAVAAKTLNPFFPLPKADVAAQQSISVDDDELLELGGAALQAEPRPQACRSAGGSSVWSGDGTA